MKNCNWEVGETVVITRTLSRHRLGVIKKITPSGLIDVESKCFYKDTARFNQDGTERGRSGFYQTNIRKADTEQIENIRKEDLIEKIKHFIILGENFQKIELGVYEMMAAAIDKAEESGKLVEESSDDSDAQLRKIVLEEWVKQNPKS